MKTTLAALLTLISVSVAGAVPRILNHQGRIAVAGTNFDGTGQFKFALVDAAGTTTFWSNDGTAAGEPAASVPVAVSKGHYAALLGEAPMAALPAALFTAEDDVRLRVWFSTDGAAFTQLAPDRRVTPSAYALAADLASDLAPRFEAGTGTDLSPAGIDGSGNLLLDGGFGRDFGAAPGVGLGGGWTVTANATDGFSAQAAFASTRVDGRGVTGHDASLAVIGGRPAIAYRSESEGDLLFARALDPAGSAWPAEASIVTVAGFGIDDAGRYASLAEVGGRPAIAYYDGSSGDLMFVRANDGAGTDWPNATTVDGQFGNVGWHASLAVVGGVPAISYISPNTGELMYAEALDAEGASWQSDAVEGAIGAPRSFTSLIDLGGEPAIATVQTGAGGGLRFVSRAGAAWGGAPLAPGAAEHPSLALIGGRPAVAYTANGELRYLRANDAGGSSWPASTPVAPIGEEPALAEFGGLPAISHRSALAGGLVFALAADAGGASWSDTTVDVSGASPGNGSSLALVDGLPGIAYRDGGALEFAALPPAGWTATLGGPAPILAEGVADGGVRASMLAPEIGTWAVSGDDLFRAGGRVGIGRIAATNALEVEGNASKTTAGSWLANSDGRIKQDIRPVEGALEKLDEVRLVDFEYTEAYRAAHPSIEAGKRYPNVVAQEFARVFPGWVRSSGEPLPDGGGEILQVDTYPLVIYSAAAIQELHAENAELRERLARLEALVERMAE